MKKKSKKKSVARYVDGFVLPVPKRKVNAYKKMAQIAAQVWMDHGALEYRECVGHDMRPHCGIPFPKLSRVKSGETVFFSWITYKSKAHRDQVNKKVMKDKRLAGCMDFSDMPFDPNRMSHGGFKILVDA